MLLLLMLQAAVAASSSDVALPGDRGPLPLAAMLGPPHPGAGPPPDKSSAPTQADSVRMANRAIALCAQRGARLGIAVVDANGVLRSAASSDGAMPGAVFIAARKATAAAAFQAPTSRVQASLRIDAGAPQLRSYMAVSPGAVPLRRDGRVIGAIGASGGTGDADETCVRDAAREAGLLEDR